ncbi:MAG: tryptophan 2,3-dioxygenase family protein [Planctomycetota bacterium]
MTTRVPNYWEYIRVEELLSLQNGLEETEDRLGNDEVVFITVHQIFELWFKLVLRELRGARDLLRRPVEEEAISGIVAGANRVTVLLERCVKHFEVMETLTTASYLGFRDKLMPASGFQSAQMRQIEILMGLDDDERIALGTESSFMQALRSHDGSDSPALRRVQRQMQDKPTLVEALDHWLWRTPIDGYGPEEDDANHVLDRFVAEYVAAHAKELARSEALALERTMTSEEEARLRERYAAERVSLEEWIASDGDKRRRRIRAALLFILGHSKFPLLAWPNALLDALTAAEQSFVIFRQRHARMVERIIGRRIGTGGSSGVDYLDQTALAYRVFKDLWAVRTYQIRPEAMPALRRPEFYGFATR